MKIKAIIFDWDGTLCQTLGLWIEAYRNALALHGNTLSPQDVSQYFLHGHDGVSGRYPRLDYDALMVDVYEIVTRNLCQAPLYDNASETLQRLTKRGVSVALVSTSARQVLRSGLEIHGLGQYFRSVLSGDDVTNIKPHPEPFQKTLHKLGADPESTLVIGDNRTDIQAGRAAGTQTCLFMPRENSAFHDFADLRRSEPNFEIDDLRQLLTM